jgi:hypothetical protein
MTWKDGVLTQKRVGQGCHKGGEVVRKFSEDAMELVRAFGRCEVLAKIRCVTRIRSFRDT